MEDKKHESSVHESHGHEEIFKGNHAPEKKEHTDHTKHADHHTKVPHHTNSKRSTKFMVMAVMLGLLIIFAGVQAYELVGLKDTLNSETTTLSASSGKQVAAAGSGSSSANLKKNLQNLPTMVGGC